MLFRTTLISEALKTGFLMIGFILISAGVFGYMFPYSNYVSGSLVGISYPYRTYSLPLGVAGLALIVVTFFLDKSAKTSTTNQQVE
jgi:hypothetical protein